MSAENNQFRINHAYPGLCSLCHSEIAEFNGSNELGLPIVTRFKGNKRQAIVRLNDKTTMTVNICKNCDDLTDEDMQSLMESEINGWVHEVNTILRDRWSYEKKKKYIDKQKKLEIIGRIDKQMKKKRGSIPKVRVSRLLTKVRR